MCVFLAQFKSQQAQPSVVFARASTPLGARVIDMGLFVWWSEFIVLGVEHMPRCAQQLTSLKDHFHDVLVAVILGTLAWVAVQKEYVHSEKKCFF